MEDTLYFIGYPNPVIRHLEDFWLPLLKMTAFGPEIVVKIVMISHWKLTHSRPKCPYRGTAGTIHPY